MEPRQITGVYGEVSGLPAPVSAHVREEQLQESRIYTVTAGERSPSLPMCAQMMMMVIIYLLPPGFPLSANLCSLHG